MNNDGVVEKEPQAPPFRDRTECELFVQYVLCDEASRPPAKHQKKPLNGIHSSGSPYAYGVRRRFRGSDRTERIRVCITAFTSMGFTPKDAYVRVAELLETELGKSGRGRRSGRQETGELMNKAETVRSVWNSRGRLATPINSHLTQFHVWRAWALVIDEEGLEFFTRKFSRERGSQAATRWRAAIEAVRREYSDFKIQIEKQWADVLQRFAIPPEAEQALRDLQLNPTWVEAALEAAMAGDGAKAEFRDEDFLRSNGVWASFLANKWIKENPSAASVWLA